MPKHRPSMKRGTHPQPQPPSARPPYRWFKGTAILLAAILAGIPFGLGRYMELHTPDPFDSGAYVYSAWHLLQGAELGVEEKPSAQMGTLLINMLGVQLLGFSETGPKLLQGVLQGAALIMMFIALGRVFGRLAASVAVVTAAVFLSAPLIAKYGNVKEQYMIAFMVLGISCLMLRQVAGKWWWVLLAGAFVSWAPLCKPIGVSAIAALGLFVLVQPIFKHRTWKQTAVDFLLMLGGALLALAPIFIWLISIDAPRNYLPYHFAWKILLPAASADAPADPAGTEGSLGTEGSPGTEAAPSPEGTARSDSLTSRLGTYVSESRQAVGWSQQAPKVLRFYWLLIVPIALALASIVLRLVRMVLHLLARRKHIASPKTPSAPPVGTMDRQLPLHPQSPPPQSRPNYDRFVLLLGLWWILDMAFVWVSSQSYEQYYLPLCASGPMLGAYLVGSYRDRLRTSSNKPLWAIVGLASLVCLLAFSWHIFIGTTLSTHTGQRYPNNQRRHGYAQRLQEIENRRMYGKGPWELLGEYIQNHSQPADPIYVWGWYPGIYVQARRFSSSPEAFMSNMHVMSPKGLSQSIRRLLKAFEKNPPLFIVDSRKQHFPFDRPPLELSPRPPQGMTTAQYDQRYPQMLAEKFGPAEARRYEAMAPFRDYVRTHYQLVRQPFGIHVLFQRIPDMKK